MARYFISSTKDDLVEQRAAVSEELGRLGHEAIWMEGYGAPGGPPLANCLADVAAADGYIGIIGFRYGSIPPEQSASYTHLEYLRARECGKPIHCFLLDEAHAKRRVSEIDERSSPIWEFRKTLGVEEHVAAFANTEDLRSELRKTIKRRDGLRLDLSGSFASIDRHEQRLALTRTLRHIVEKPSSPHVVVVCGDVDQDLYGFVSLLRASLAPRAFGNADALDHSRIVIGNPGRLVEMIANQLGEEAMCEPDSSPTEIVDGLIANHPGGFVIDIGLEDKVWDGGADPLAAIDEHFARWRSDGYPVLVVVRVVYPVDASGSTWRQRRRDRRRRETMARSVRALRGERISVLPELADVGRADAQAWAEGNDLLSEPQRRKVVYELIDLYRTTRPAGGDAALPMKTLVEHLDRMINSEEKQAS